MSSNEGGEIFTKNQLEQIEQGKRDGVNVSEYAKPEFNSLQMNELRLGLMEGIDIHKYANPKLNSFQMSEIRKGLESKIDISLYSAVDMAYEKMKEIRLGLEEGINLAMYKTLPAGMLEMLRKAIKAKVNIMNYVRKGYNPEQLEQIIEALKNKIDPEPYINTEMRGIAIKEVCEGISLGIDVTLYARPEYEWRQMREIRLGIENRVDINEYNNPYYNWMQMKEIRLGLEDGLDVSGYANLMYTAKDMEKKRNALLKQIVDGILDSNDETHIECASMFVISEDEMECNIIYDEKDKGLSYDDLIKLIRGNRVKKGLIESNIRQIADGNVADGSIVTIAKGKKPVAGKDGWYEYFFRTEIARTPKHLEDGSVDYQDVEWFEIVEEGQTVAVYHDAEEGTAGFTVSGRILPAPKGKEKKMLHGKGFDLADNNKRYVSKLSGRIELKNDELIISRLFIFDEVNMATGNVNVDGNVYIKGDVGSNTVIKATGDIAIDGYIESAYVESSENIFLRKGINSGGHGIVKAGKSVTAKYFEAVVVYAGENILCNYCMDATLNAEGIVVQSGEKGAVLGGRIKAVQGVKVFNAGNQAEIATYINMGISNEMHQKAATIDAKLADVAKELSVLNKALESYKVRYKAEERNNMPVFIKLENAVYTKEKENEGLLMMQEEINKKMETASKATGIFTGTVYDGVVVEIDGVSWKAKTIQNIKLSRVNDRVAVYRI